MVRDREFESLLLTATDFESVVAAITPIPHIHLKPTSYLIAISSIGSWMMSFCPYITFTIVSLCQWNTIASYSKCLLVIRRCLKLYPVSMPVRCDIDLTVIFKSCRALYCLSIPIPFIMPNRLTGAPYLALGNYAIYAYLICLTHVPIIRTPRVLIAFCKCGHDQLYNDGCSSNSI